MVLVALLVYQALLVVVGHCARARPKDAAGHFWQSRHCFWPRGRGCFFFFFKFNVSS